MKAVLIKNGVIIKRGQYPRTDMNTIINLEDGLEWLLINEDTIPTYDSRIYNLVTTETITGTPHPIYPNINQLHVTYSLLKRSNEEIESNIIDAENSANSQVVPNKEQLKLLLLGVAISLENLTLTGKKELIKNRLVNLALKIWNNDTNMKAKIQDLANGNPLNLDDGWDL